MRAATAATLGVLMIGLLIVGCSAQPVALHDHCGEPIWPTSCEDRQAQLLEVTHNPGDAVVLGMSHDGTKAAVAVSHGKCESPGATSVVSSTPDELVLLLPLVSPKLKPAPNDTIVVCPMILLTKIIAIELGDVLGDRALVITTQGE